VDQPATPSPFVRFVRKAKPIDHQAEQLAADQRDLLALTKFFNVMLNDTLRASCSRCGSSQHAKRKGKRNGAR
jgi:hypothetical protein